MRLTEFFDRTFIINLPERKDRYRETIAEFRAVKMPLDKVQFFPAIRCTEAAGFPTIGTRGCFLSHLAVLDKAVEEKAENVLIIEDDIAFHPEMKKYEDDLAQYIQSLDWDILYFGYMISKDVSVLRPLVDYKEKVATTHCYAINSRIFRKMSDFMHQVCQRAPGHPDGGPMHYDGAISTFRMQNPDLITLLHVPCLAYQRASRTDLHALKWFDRYPIARTLATSARMAKNYLIRRSSRNQ